MKSHFLFSGEKFSCVIAEKCLHKKNRHFLLCKVTNAGKAEKAEKAKAPLDSYRRSKILQGHYQVRIFAH